MATHAVDAVNALACRHVRPAPVQLPGAFYYRLALLLAMGFMLQGCALPTANLSATASATASDAARWSPVQSVLESRQSHLIVQQWDLSCGAAALATLMNFQHGEAFTEKMTAQAMLRRSDPLTVRVKGGFSLLDMKRFAQQHGYRGRAFQQLDFAQLTALVPAIVPVDLGGYRHFLIVRTAIADRVLVADPAFGNRVLRRQEFLRAWLAGIAFVVSRNDAHVPPGRLGVEPVDFVRVPAQVVRQALR